MANFAPVLHEKYTVGVPFAGKYKEIFNSEDEKFGGKGAANPRVKTSKAEACDGRPDSITIRIPELAVLVFVCTPEKPAKKEAPAKAAGDKTGGAKKSSGKTSPESLVDSVKKAAVKKAGSVKKAAADTAGSVKKAAADKAGSVKKAAADTADSVKKAATKKAKSVKNALSGNAAGGTEKVGQS